MAPEKLDRKPDWIELLAATIHDMRKPDTRVEYPDGNVRFPGHEVRAAADVPGIAAALGLTRADASRLEFVVRHHGDANDFPLLTPQILAELRSSPWFESLCLLHNADSMSCLMPGGKTLPCHWEMMRKAGA
jgi:hypothetical protein